MNIEFEAKFLDVDVRDFRERLLACGGVQKKQQHLLRRKLFNFPFDQHIQQWIRVRDEGDQVVVTLKRIVDSTKIDGTYESEYQVESFEKACSFFESCGFISGAYQENYREIWELDGVEITIDTWPGLHPFVEIEAVHADEVRSCAERLGFDFSQAYFGSVSVVYERVLQLSSHDLQAIPELTFDTIALVLKNIQKHRDEKK